MHFGVNLAAAISYLLSPLGRGELWSRESCLNEGGDGVCPSLTHTTFCGGRVSDLAKGGRFVEVGAQDAMGQQLCVVEAGGWASKGTDGPSKRPATRGRTADLQVQDSDVWTCGLTRWPGNRAWRPHR